MQSELYNIQFGIMISSREVQYGTRWSYSAVSIENNMELWNNSSNLIKKIYISRLELQRWPLEFVISFFKVYIWDLGLRFAKFFGIMFISRLDTQWTDEISGYIFQIGLPCPVTRYSSFCLSLHGCLCNGPPGTII